MLKSVSIARKQHKANSPLTEISVVSSSRAKVTLAEQSGVGVQPAFITLASKVGPQTCNRLWLPSMLMRQVLEGKPKKASLDNSQSISSGLRYY